MNQLTVRELHKLCQEQIWKGNGGKHIIIPDDNEGNGFHGLFLGFSDCTPNYKDLIYDSNYTEEKDAIILG